MLSDLLYRLRALLQRQRVEDELDDELRFHIEQETRARSQTGTGDEAAVRRARVRFGGVEQVKEECREAWGVSLITNAIRDAQFAVRMLGKNPEFTAVAIGTLALGIGANTAIFSAVTGILLRPLPYKDADQLVMLWEQNPGRGWYHNIVSAANYNDWRERNHVFSEMAAFTSPTYNLTGDGEPVEVVGEQVTPNMFSVLGIAPVYGRTFTGAEGRPGGPRTVLLGYGFWQARFGAESDIIGRQIAMNGESYTVIGVMPPGFTGCDGCLGGRKPVVWTSGLDASPRNRTDHSLRVIARLKPGATIERGQSEMDGIGRAIEREHPANKGWRVQVLGVREDSVRMVRPAILVLVGAVILVLLMACVNVANILLARGASREREMAIRVAMGAGRRRVITQLLTESAMLAIGGGGFGLAIAYGGTTFLKAYAPADVTPGLNNLGLNLPVLMYSFGLACVTGLLFGLVPALIVSKQDLNSGLRQSGKGATDHRKVHALRGFLVAAEFAFSIVLVIGATLMIRSFAAVSRVPLGFDTSNVLTMRIPLRSVRYRQPERVSQFFAQLLPRVESIPGVASASASRGLPIEDWAGMSFITEESPTPREGEEPDANYVVISPHYFEVMRIPLLRGRWFADRDIQSSSPVAIVNEKLASDLWPGANALGRHLRMGTVKSERPRLTVVGVVRNAMTDGPSAGARPEIYVPHTQYPWSLSPRHLVVRTAAGANRAAVVAAIRKLVVGIDSDQPLTDVRPLDEIAHQPLAIRQFLMYLLTAFGALALVLASLGVFGVLSWSVSQRTREIGIRMALGAERREVLGQVIRRGMVMALIGVCAGVAGAWGLTRYLESLLFQVKPRDPVTFLLVPVMLLVVAAIASYIPARRATKVDPMVALRYE